MLFKKVKYSLVILFLIFSCKKEKNTIDYLIKCKEEVQIIEQYPDNILITFCSFKNHLFKSIGTPDYKGRYSYDYKILEITKSDTLEINNSKFFNNNSNALEHLVNKKLKAQYESNLKIPEIKECIKAIDFRNYSLNEFGIAISDKGEITFNINHNIGSACFNVKTSSVTFNLTDIQEYVK